MATTGFWPVKDRLKEVIDYTETPDKTIAPKYVDRDLYAALQYVSDDKKTDERMYVSGINCNAGRSYERMMATKKRFGKTGRNVAYHGYIRFKVEDLRGFFPKNYTAKQMTDTILKLLYDNQRKMERIRRNREER